MKTTHTYSVDLSIRIDAKLNQMVFINQHSINLLNEGKTQEQIQVWCSLFDDLEAEVESLILIKECLYS
jgi:hypothetical protein